jgi:hypothetical protein
MNNQDDLKSFDLANSIESKLKINSLYGSMVTFYSKEEQIVMKNQMKTELEKRRILFTREANSQN